MIAGLGNPGAQYQYTRHNVGFTAINYLQDELKARPPKVKFNGLLYQAEVKGRKILLVQPQTYMNNSGECLRQVLDYYKLPTNHLLVIYDDIDLPEGKVRVRAKGGPGTHNGMRSIVENLKSEDFPRVRIGIGTPPHPEMALADYVLGTFPKEAHETMKHAVIRAAGAACAAVTDGIDKAMNQFNTME